ncbi:nucleoside hydrolase [Furfurilactobacillus rossiae]|uniref:ABC transporter binding protein n=1 Tax=Furfurilactobacillus rossiae DSM 15814 TaxID=1114972 RepID=A0A0R1R8C1_9LACO|nr:ABC transporter binding protein [Furfurilactobacillus rossiae DSM 15814]QFR67479.1 ABC transporter substrate-binding protein [Furfurilactobacillus rossiae]QLE60428.1 Inosine-uridine preferring nucleoside hydrolase [Furfurilactobacillus rossiae]
MNEMKVYFNHDGGVDDLTSLFLLLQMPEVELLGVGVMGADSYVEPATSATRKIIDRFGSGKTIEVASSDAGTRHPFPTAWRMETFSMTALPLLNEYEPIKTPLRGDTAANHLQQILSGANEPITLLFTGPLTDLATVIHSQPELTDKIARLVWMGGTFLDRGNVEEPEADGHAEWNAFWDAEAVKTVWNSGIKVDMVGLESTNNVPLTSSVRRHWAHRRQQVGFDFLGNSYALVPELRHFVANSTYFLWDVLATCYLTHPEITTTKLVYGDVITEGPSLGRTILAAAGRPIKLVETVNSVQFFDLIDTLATTAK